MDKQIRKLKKLIDKHLNDCKYNIQRVWGKPSKSSDKEVWFYNCYRWGIFWEKIIFIFEEDQVIDISISQYILWMECKCIFYYQYETPEYRVITLM